MPRNPQSIPRGSRRIPKRAQKYRLDFNFFLIVAGDLFSKFVVVVVDVVGVVVTAAVEGC